MVCRIYSRFVCYRSAYAAAMRSLELHTLCLQFLSFLKKKVLKRELVIVNLEGNADVESA